MKRNILPNVLHFLQKQSEGKMLLTNKSNNKTFNSNTSSLNFSNWTSEQVAKCLSKPKEEGGIGLSENQYAPLIKANIDGLVLDIIYSSADANKRQNILPKFGVEITPEIKQALPIIMNWLKSYSQESYLQRINKAENIFGVLNISFEWQGNGLEKIRPPFVGRYEAILETIETIFKLGTYEKPKMSLISTTMGMGKSSFLFECISQFLTSKFSIYFSTSNLSRP